MALTGTAATIVATTLALTATVAGGPVLAVVGTVTMVATAAMGAGMAVMGVSDATQGAMEVYNAVTGNPDPAPNLIRDTVFGDNQEAYNQAEAMLSFGTTVGLTATSALPLVITTSTSGAISYYAKMNTSGSGSGGGSNTVDPNDIRFSQSSVNGSAAIVESMVDNGWDGDPIDVVVMPDGELTTIDNTRVVAARQAGIDVQANIHAYDDLLPDEYIDRFTTKNGVPTTWGEAITLRIGNQNATFRNNNPFGSINMENIT